MIPFLKALGAVLRLRCPNCSKGKLFIDPNLLHLKNLDKMPDTCPHCGQDFKVEPEFYFGAMFVSYILVAFIMFFIMGIDILLSGYLYRNELFLYLGIIALGYPYWLRVSRAIWLLIYIRGVQPNKHI